MQFGFFDSLAVLLVLPAVIAAEYTFAWPGVTGRRLAFLGVTLGLGIVIGTVAWWWAVSPLQTLGFSGQPNYSGQPSDTSISELSARIYLAFGAVAVGQVGLCYIAARLIGKP